VRRVSQFPHTREAYNYAPDGDISKSNLVRRACSLRPSLGLSLGFRLFVGDDVNRLSSPAALGFADVDGRHIESGLEMRGVEFLDISTQVQRFSAIW
jgi:hypothetical protein